jgi:hypothetical protein
MLEKAIAKQLTINKKPQKQGEPQLEEIIKNVSVEKLHKFIIAQAKYNSDFHNAVLLEFAVNDGGKKGNIYSGIIQKALASVDFEEDEYYYSEESQDIDALDQWLEKAQSYIKLKKYNEAVLICKAIIEEYSQWLYNIGESPSEYFYYEYQSIPFDIITNAVKHIDKKELFNYCLSEMKNKKYTGTDFYFNFHKLLAKLAVTVDPDTFIALQDELLAGIKDKGSHQAEIILTRKIDFYRQINQPDKAWAIIKENLQIESYCLIIVNDKIKKQEFTTAKKLINDFINKRIKNTYHYSKHIWYELLLYIAQEENDIPAIKELAFRFIKDNFDEKFFQIYKKAFNPTEWEKERERLLLHYKRKYFSHSVADLLASEKETKLLVEYIEKYLSIERLESYYKVFAPDYPEKTIELFKKSLVLYAKNNIGRSCYENLLVLLRKMSRIKGGKKVSLELVTGFKTQYKNRRAMMEVLSKFK